PRLAKCLVELDLAAFDPDGVAVTHRDEAHSLPVLHPQHLDLRWIPPQHPSITRSPTSCAGKNRNFRLSYPRAFSRCRMKRSVLWTSVRTTPRSLSRSPGIGEPPRELLRRGQARLSIEDRRSNTRRAAIGALEHERVAGGHVVHHLGIVGDEKDLTVVLEACVEFDQPRLDLGQPEVELRLVEQQATLT